MLVKSYTTEYIELMKDKYAVWRSLPNGGPRLCVLFADGYWRIGDGTWRYGKMRTRQDTNAVLKAAGFISHRLGNDYYYHTY